MEIVHRLYDICLLRRGPQDLPFSYTLLVLAALADIVVTSATYAPDFGAKAALLQAVVALIILAALLRAALALRDMPARFTQTLTAIAGTNVLIGLVFWPVSLWMRDLERAKADVTVPMLLLVALLIWSLFISGHILRHALSVSLPAGVLTALLFAIAIRGVIVMVFPV